MAHNESLNLKALNWPLAIGLGAIALIRPLFSITGVNDVLGTAPTAIGLTALISLVWILSVALTRVAQPFLTLVFAGLAYGAYAIIVSGVLSPILDGRLEGPLTNPFAFVAVLVTNAIWGALCGALALLVRQFRR
jgi:hypothetical protein